ncbi:phenylalanine--tRNA ligase subunit beta [Sutterella sp.]|uniref:phenylalanine--tRNA ligase subunit beta n=1 Tax=Sutterella sp. TaxID=1981025 RepID=UPI0026DEA7B0|nr:phenylalanine--tRNA ligase subunit beta [Sutterella sp.]MDO5530540.1 phenylalanine--tRNA ligase subunit beta [Sutterella sp.]
MIFTEEWLRQYVNPALSTDELADALTMAGLEVEEVTACAPAFTGVVVGEVLTCRDHENSDHLHVCEVNVGTGENLQIVCGAPNCRAGIKVACAMIGAVLPGDFRIKKSKLRGVVSMGMLCSTRELGINDNHDGIWILADDAPVGADIREYARLDDAKIELKLTPNRGDALSVVGVARDVHAITGAPLILPSMAPVPANSDVKLPVTIEAADLCGRFSHRVIKGLNGAAKTPDWMKARLERAGQRPISALVDISNYVMLELGRPSHFYDLNKIHGDSLSVRWAREGEKVELLNGQTVDLTPWFGVICANDTPECLAGIMGGESSSITEETTDLFIESAFWFPKAIQGRCRKLNFSTDAAYRYERGVDFASTVEHIEYITQLVLDICGTPETKVGPVEDVQANIPERKPVTMRVDRCCKVVGVDIPVEAMEASFTRLGFEHTFENGVFTVIPPSFRFDIEIEEDLIEEVARIWGYEKLPDRPPLTRTAMKISHEERRTGHTLRRELAKLGYQELINFSFVPEEWEKAYADNDKPIRLLNPIASQLSVMRTQLIGGLVDILRYNLNRRAERVRVFELGRVFFPDESVASGPWTVKGVHQPQHIAGLAYGDALDSQWGVAGRRTDFFDVKGDVERLVAPLKVRFVAETFPALHPGRSAGIYLGDKRIGFIGELHPRVMQQFELTHAPVVFEIEVEPVLNVPLPTYTPVSKFQPVTRDLAVVVPAATEVETLFNAVSEAKKKDLRLAPLTSFRLFDLYRPKEGAGADEKSLAFAIELNSRTEEALTELQTEGAVRAILEALESVGARLRA